MRRVFLAVLALTLANYLAMALWTAPRLLRAAGGLPLFDMRALGYGYHDVRIYLAVLDAPGRELYLTGSAGWTPRSRRCWRCR